MVYVFCLLLILGERVFPDATKPYSGSKKMETYVVPRLLAECCCSFFAIDYLAGPRSRGDLTRHLLDRTVAE
jgi:hypothetical protein